MTFKFKRLAIVFLGACLNLLVMTNASQAEQTAAGGACTNGVRPDGSACAMQYPQDPCRVKGGCGIGGTRSAGGRIGNVLSSMRGRHGGTGYRRHRSSHRRGH